MTSVRTDKAGETIHSVAVVGLGNVGSLVAEFLQDGGREVLGVSREPRTDANHPTMAFDVSDGAALRDAIRNRDAVVSCLPFHLNVPVAEAARELGIHYFDLTEDVGSTERVTALAAGAPTVMMPHCGLAPGFIAVVGADLTRNFQELRSIQLRVGALPTNPTGLLGYAFTWSPEGVINEYLKNCEVIRGGQRTLVPAMSQVETVVVGGHILEAFTTSGGLGTMCDTYDNRVETLDYKTLRYPGHCQLMRFFFDELHMRERPEDAAEILVNAKPPVDEDVVYVHAAVEGRRDGRPHRDEYVRAFRPREILGRKWRAISWTTAASVCAAVELVSLGATSQHGLIRQEELPLAAFLGTRTGSLFVSAGG